MNKARACKVGDITIGSDKCTGVYFDYKLNISEYDSISFFVFFILFFLGKNHHKNSNKKINCIQFVIFGILCLMMI